MEPLREFKAIVAPLDRANVDTDAIIPKQFLKSIKRSGFGVYLFDEWRYLDHGEPGMDCTDRPINQDFVLNQPRYAEAGILLTRENFGCGSSREHAPWAIADYGFRVLVAPSFAEIFYNNCFKNGILPVTADAAVIERLFNEVAATEGYALDVNLETQQITTPGGEVIAFEVDPFRREALLEGLDDIDLTLRHTKEIKAYEDARRYEYPWLYQ